MNCRGGSGAHTGLGKVVRSAGRRCAGLGIWCSCRLMRWANVEATLRDVPTGRAGEGKVMAALTWYEDLSCAPSRYFMQHSCVGGW